MNNQNSEVERAVTAERERCLRMVRGVGLSYQVAARIMSSDHIAAARMDGGMLCAERIAKAILGERNDPCQVGHDQASSDAEIIGGIDRGDLDAAVRSAEGAATSEIG